MSHQALPSDQPDAPVAIVGMGAAVRRLRPGRPGDATLRRYKILLTVG